LLVAFAVFIGLLFGSFATVAAHRIPRRETIAEGRSKCPHCGAQIKAYDNIPVVSYLVLGGKCRNCGTGISIKYPLIELATGILFGLAAWKFDVSIATIAYAGLAWVLVVLTVIDIEEQILPNRVVYPAQIAGIVLLVIDTIVEGYDIETPSSFWLGLVTVVSLTILYLPGAEPPETVEEGQEAPEKGAGYGLLAALGLVTFAVWIALIVFAFIDGRTAGITGALVGAGIFGGFLSAVGDLATAATKRAAMGGGDVRLAVLLGTFLGYVGAPDVVLAGMFLSFLVGGLAGVVWMLVARGGRKMEIPFGPFLAAGTIIGIYVGQDIADAYLDLF
jgi:leader peptidase (prepilin peptidase) / N-methyltransferase